MKILDAFIDEYKTELTQEQSFQTNLEGEVKSIKAKLLDERFLPSVQLKNILNKQLRRCHYPIEIAIVGQFSSGKSTFLNALLSKDILPMGITPVTSKVTYINYAEEYKLKVTYKSGAEKYLPTDEIAKFIDQREDAIESIKYLTVYAPIELLKEISFVDTPGLNSQSTSDTQETLKALNDVGGIIWLSLIDNAGKLSEEEMLEKYMKNFKNKSLCILNQKDKFKPEQIAETKSYIENKFSKYFSKVTPISAKRALEARAQQKDVLLQEEENIFLQLISKAIKEKQYTQDFYLQSYEKYSKKIAQIEQNEYSNIIQMQEESNIDEVLDFITNVIKPQAKEAKTFVIRKDLQGICDILMQEYRVLIEVDTALIEILKKSELEILMKFDALKEIATSDLMMLYESFKLFIEEIASEIYKNVHTETEYYYEEKNSFLSKENYLKKELKIYKLDKDAINKILFYDDQKVEKKIKKLIKRLDQVDMNIQTSFDDIFANIKEKIVAWQKPYELIKKNREISSDLEFSGTRHFASKVFETLLQYYYYVLYENLTSLHKRVSLFQGNIEKSSFCIVEFTLHSIEERIRDSLEFHISDPQSFAIYHPREEDILKSLQDGFKLENIESFLISNRNYIKSTLLHTKEEYKKVNSEKIEFVKVKRDALEEKMSAIKEIQESIRYV